jgi:phospholipid/cholesterol/gamma-HCH transport system permease protein
MPDPAIPRLQIETNEAGVLVRATGVWIVQQLAVRGRMDGISAQISHLRTVSETVSWDLSGISRIDHLGAQFFWNYWGRQLPQHLLSGTGHDAFFERLSHLGDVSLQQSPKLHFAWLYVLGNALFSFGDHVLGFIRMLGQLVLDSGQLIKNPLRGPWREVSANIFYIGAQALGITALVGFLIGVVLSYLSSQQLRLFGADIYIVDILGLAIIRELGPMLAAILVAGRSGSAITAQLGVMRVTEELDAMLVMGIPHGFRLILPRVLALIIAMPLIVVWTDVMALIGGMVSAKSALGLSFSFFIDTLPAAVKLPNLWLGVGKGAAFGMLIALTACHYGLRIAPNTASLGQGTTASVVTSITLVILADAVFAILFKDVGI